MEKEELTILEAADVLNVSASYFTKLLDEGKIPSRKGRITKKDLLVYQQEVKRRRNAALDKPVSEAQEMGMY